MVRALRSRSKRRKAKRTPGGKLKTYYVKKKGKSLVTCPNCGRKISGTNINSTAKTQRRPTRKFPELCTKCAREKIKELIRI